MIGYYFNNSYNLQELRQRNDCIIINVYLLLVVIGYSSSNFRDTNLPSRISWNGKTWYDQRVLNTACLLRKIG